MRTQISLQKSYGRLQEMTMNSCDDETLIRIIKGLCLVKLNFVSRLESCHDERLFDET